MEPSRNLARRLWEAVEPIHSIVYFHPAATDAGKALGFTPAYLPADGFGKLIASDDAKLAQLMADLGLKK